VREQACLIHDFFQILRHFTGWNTLTCHSLGVTLACRVNTGVAKLLEGARDGDVEGGGDGIRSESVGTAAGCDNAGGGRGNISNKKRRARNKAT